MIVSGGAHLLFLSTLQERPAAIATRGSTRLDDYPVTPVLVRPLQLVALITAGWPFSCDKSPWHELAVSLELQSRVRQANANRQTHHAVKLQRGLNGRRRQ
jgi:hypothetical protein